jgi:hypothetical protein
MDIFKEIQNWYTSQCDGDWEHGSGIKIDTLDNPGWTVKINLEDTDIENKPLKNIEPIATLQLIFSLGVPSRKML